MSDQCISVDEFVGLLLIHHIWYLCLEESTKKIKGWKRKDKASVRFAHVCQTPCLGTRLPFSIHDLGWNWHHSIQHWMPHPAQRSRNAAQATGRILGENTGWSPWKSKYIEASTDFEVSLFYCWDFFFAWWWLSDSVESSYKDGFLLHILLYREC